MGDSTSSSNLPLSYSMFGWNCMKSKGDSARLSVTPDPPVVLGQRLEEVARVQYRPGPVHRRPRAGPGDQHLL